MFRSRRRRVRRAASIRRAIGTLMATACILAGLASVANGQSTTVMLPDAASGGPESANCLPFGAQCQNGASSVRFQQVFAGAQFGDQPVVVDKVRFRRACGTAPFDPIPFDLQVRLSNTTAPADALSPDMNANVGSDETVVLDESALELSSLASGSDCPYAPDFELDLDDSFVFDSSLGNLLMEIRVRNTLLNRKFDGIWLTGNTAQAVVWGGPGTETAATASAVRPYGLFVEFVLAAAAVDSDLDGVMDDQDNCIGTANPQQIDTDSDGVGDACDPDDDGDQVADAIDNCPLVYNPDQLDRNHDGIGDACVSPGALAGGASLGLGSSVGSGSRLLQNVTIGTGATIGSGTMIHRNTVAGDGFAAGDDVQIAKDVTIGDRVTLESGVRIDKDTVIGDDVDIAADTVVGIGVTIGSGVTIGQGVWIEEGVVIGDGAHIEDGAVIRRGAWIGVDVWVGIDAQVGMSAVIDDNVVLDDEQVVRNRAHVR